MYANILVPVALDHNPNLQQALDLAGRLRDPGGRIRLLHVLDAIPAYVASELPETVQSATLADARERLAALAAGLPDSDAEVVTGHAGRTILDHAAKHGCDCIVVASHKPGLQDYFLGSTAAHVVRHAGCSVHVLR